MFKDSFHSMESGFCISNTYHRRIFSIRISCRCELICPEILLSPTGFRYLCAARVWVSLPRARMCSSSARFRRAPAAPAYGIAILSEGSYHDM
jgi:hypothetical protein